MPKAKAVAIQTNEETYLDRLERTRKTFAYLQDLAEDHELKNLIAETALDVEHQHTLIIQYSEANEQANAVIQEQAAQLHDNNQQIDFLLSEISRIRDDPSTDNRRILRERLMEIANGKLMPADAERVVQALMGEVYLSPYYHTSLAEMFDDISTFIFEDQIFMSELPEGGIDF